MYHACDAMCLSFTCCCMRPGKRASLGDIYVHDSHVHPVMLPPSPFPPLPVPFFQFDFQSQVLSSIQHGTRTKKVEFTDITGYTSEVSDYLGGLVISSCSNTHILWYLYIFVAIMDHFKLFLPLCLLYFTNKQCILKVLNSHMLNGCVLHSYKFANLKIYFRCLL